MKKLIPIALLFLFSCGNETRVEEPEALKVEAVIPVIANKCINNKDSLVFDRKIRVADNTLGYARVRSNSGSFHPGDNDNYLGKVACGSILNAYLPEIYRPIVDGIMESTRNPYYIIQVKDSTGNDCIAYIARHVIEEVK